MGDVAAVEQLVVDLHELKVRRLRTQFSWADWHTGNGESWYEWLIPRLASEFELLPCFSYMPPSLGIEPSTASPPRDPKAYADFLDQVIDRFGEHFEWMELWNEPNNLNDWDWHLDHDWKLFSSMIAQAASWVRRRGKKTVLGGMCPTDPNWLALLANAGVLEHIDAVGIHGFPGTWDFGRHSWSRSVGDARAVLDAQGVAPQIWLTEVGYSTWRNDEIEQLRQLREALDAPVDRIYWYGASDLHDSLSHQDGFHADERHYHFGLRDQHRRPKLLYRMWASGGFDSIEEIASLQRHHGVGLERMPSREPASLPGVATLLAAAHEAALPAAAGTSLAGDAPGDGPQSDAMLVNGRRVSRGDGQRPALITGGTGFVGTNLAARLLSAEEPC